MLRLQRAVVRDVGEQRGVVGAERLDLAHELGVAPGGESPCRALSLEQRKGRFQLRAAVDSAPGEERPAEARPHAILEERRRHGGARE